VKSGEGIWITDAKVSLKQNKKIIKLNGKYNISSADNGT
jgi:hypothetical protein